MSEQCEIRARLGWKVSDVGERDVGGTHTGLYAHALRLTGGDEDESPNTSGDGAHGESAERRCQIDAVENFVSKF